MGWTGIDLDDELVACVAEALGTSTTTETVNMALREVLEIRRRAPAVKPVRFRIGTSARAEQPGAGGNRFVIRETTDGGRR